MTSPKKQMPPARAAAPAGGRGYSTREVAALIGFPPARVRRFVQRGIVRPHRGKRDEYRFSFQDVALLRTARRLLDAEVPARRVLDALGRLRSRTGEDESLSAVRIYAEGNTVVVREADTLWEPISGQCRLPLARRERSAEVRPLAAPAVSAAQVRFEALDSDDWYNLGLDLEEVEPARAPDAYRRAIALDPDNADAHVNLGRLYQIVGDLRRAKRHYQLALDAVADHELAYYNLGTVFDELDEYDMALDYYRRAAGIPDAHYNLARIFGLRGDELASLRHLRRYRQLGGK